MRCWTQPSPRRRGRTAIANAYRCIRVKVGPDAVSAAPRLLAKPPVQLLGRWPLPKIGAAASPPPPNELAEKLFRPRPKAFHATVLCNRGTTTATAGFGSKLWKRFGCVRYRTNKRYASCIIVIWLSIIPLALDRAHPPARHYPARQRRRNSCRPSSTRAASRTSRSSATPSAAASLSIN